MSEKKASLSRRKFLKLASSTIAASVLAACAPGVAPTPDQQPDAPTAVPPTQGPITIRYGSHGGPEERAENKKLFEEMYPNVTVEVEQIMDFPTKVAALAAAGTLPDVTRMWEAMVLDMARAGQVIDLNPMIDATPDFNPQDFYEVFWNYPVIDGRRFGIADASAPHFTFYNKDLYDQAGVPYPDPEKFTWDDYVEKARMISRPQDQIWGSDSMIVGWQYWNMKMVWQNGGDFFSEDYKTCTLDQPEAYEAIQYWADLLHEAQIMPSLDQAAGVGAGVGGDLFQTGHVAMQRIGVWIQRVMLEAPFKWGMVPEPMNVRKATILHTAFNAISKTSKNQDMAWKWIALDCSPDGMYNFCLTGGLPTPRRSSNERKPWYMPGIDSEAVGADLVPLSNEYGRLLPGPANEGEALKLIGDALEAVYTGKQTAERVFKEVAPKVTSVINT